MAELTFDNVSFTYPGAAAPVIDRLSFVVPQAEAHALLGASGAGKTTVLNLMSGLLFPQSGRILLDGEDVTRQPGAQRRVAQVFQFPVLYESLSVQDNLGVPLRAGDIPAAERQARLLAVAQELGLSDVLARKPKLLSLYQKQLLAVGKALVRTDTRLVLLDEPLTSVDPAVKWALRQTLRKCQRDFGVTMVYVTHDQTEALTFADRVSILTAQGLVQTGTPEEIYTSPANEYVADFVGSPGMNLCPVDALIGTRPDAAQTVGFRPEWASLQAHPAHNAVPDHAEDTSPSPGLVGRVVSSRPQGTSRGHQQNLLGIHTASGQLCHVLSDMGAEINEEVMVTLQRQVWFRDGERL